MTCRTESKTINDIEYDVTQWNAEKAILMKLKIMKVFGAGFAKLAGHSEETEADALSDGLATLFENNSPEDILALIKSCLIGVAVDGKRMTETSFNEHFKADDILTVYQLFLFVLKVNFGNLLQGQLAERFLAKVEKSV